MKKIILTTFTILSLTIGFSQTNFKWEKIDSVQKTKAQIYSDTKMFIAETWKSSQNVIQNDDKESGMILVKGLQEESFGRVAYHYVYSYTVKFLIKDNKYKIILENVNCDRAYVTGSTNSYTPCKIEPFDDYENKHKTCEHHSQDAVNTMMKKLKDDLQSIINSYDKYIKTNSGW